MANIFQEKKRSTIPNWRFFKTTVCLGELNNTKQTKLLKTQSIDKYISDWINYKDLIHAVELVSAALVNNIQENEIIESAARYILITKNSTSIHKSFAYLILYKQKKIFSDNDLTDINDLIDKESIYKRIHFLKEQLNFFPKNSILLVDISLLYTIIGELEKARYNMLQAVYLSPNNRFVLRSFVRMFLKLDKEYAHKILLKSPNVLKDPWLMSAEISLSFIRNQNSKLMKKAYKILESDINPYDKTELASSLGTVELFRGNKKRSKKLFQKSLESPNDNSLAQSEWISEIFKIFSLDARSYQIKKNYEALAIDDFYNDRWIKAADNSIKWFLDMPFSRKPILLASYILGSILNDHLKAIRILKAGLTSNPKDAGLLNNLAYSYALLNDVENAERYINQITCKTDINIPNNICTTATKGLILFRKKRFDEGRQLYLKAIKEAQTRGDDKLYILAYANYVREEIKANSNNKEKLIKKLIDSSQKVKESDIKQVIQNILGKRYLKKIEI